MKECDFLFFGGGSSKHTLTHPTYFLGQDPHPGIYFPAVVNISGGGCDYTTTEVRLPFDCNLTALRAPFYVTAYLCGLLHCDLNK